MRVGFLNGVALAGLVFLSGAAGVLLVKMTSPMRPAQLIAPAPESIFAAPGPAAVSMPTTTNAMNGAQQFARSCVGAFAEAKSVGILPGFAILDAGPPRPGSNGENFCSAKTASSRYDVAYFARCSSGDTCAVLARVTQDGQYVLFHRD